MSTFVGNFSVRYFASQKFRQSTPMSLPFKCLSRISWRIETSNKFATNKKKHSLKYHISSKLPLVLDKPKFEVIFEDEWLLVRLHF